MFELDTNNSPDFFLASFLSEGEARNGLTIVTGPRGAGKTSWCRVLLRRARQQGVQPAGLISPAVFSASEKIGIDLCDLASGQKRHLAYRNQITPSTLAIPHPIETQQWMINQQTIAWGNAILAGLEQPRFLMIDELGPLEFERGLGLVAGLKLLDAHKGLAVAVIRPSLLGQALDRWPWAEVIQITEPGTFA